MAKKKQRIPGDRSIYYRGGIKYQLARDFSIQTPVRPRADIVTEFVELRTDGLLIVSAPYAWDGPSGPTRDTKSAMRGSGAHDPLYYLMRHGYIDPAVWRRPVDRFFKRLCREDGMGWIRAFLWLRAVRKFAANAASEEAIRKVIKAP